MRLLDDQIDAATVRGLLVALAICGPLSAVFFLFGVSKIAVPLFLAATIEFGLLVVAAAWRAIRRAHPDPR